MKQWEAWEAWEVGDDRVQDWQNDAILFGIVFISWLFTANHHRGHRFAVIEVSFVIIVLVLVLVLV